MKLIDLLRKLGIFRSGAIAATYHNAKERPIELQMHGVLNAKKDLVNPPPAPGEDKRPHSQKR